MCIGKTRWTTDLIGTLALVVLLSNPSLVWADGRQVYQQAVHGVALVITPESEGTAWVVDRQRKMLVTAHHVIADPATGKGYDEVKVVFPVFENGRPIAERTYYRDHVSSLAVRGVVLDGESEHDLAVIVLDKLPAHAEALKLAAGTAGRRRLLPPGTVPGDSRRDDRGAAGPECGAEVGPAVGGGV